MQRAGQEFSVLRPEWLVEAQCRDRVFALDLVGERIDQDIDRIADRVDADEDEYRHHEHHQQGLQAAAYDVDEHGRIGSDVGNA